MKEFTRRLLPRTPRPHRILSGPLRGKRIATSWHDYPAAIRGRTESNLLRWFGLSVNKGETWLDVGAHYGYTAIALCGLVGSSGRVFAFEPVLATVGHLSRTRELNSLTQLRIVPFGLSDCGQILAVTVPVNRGMADLETRSTAAPVEVIYTVALDSVWQGLSEGNPRIDGVKVDVQGMEAQVLAGMRQLLVLYRPKLVVELHAGVDRAEFLSVITSLGYSIVAAPIDSLPGERPTQIESDRSYVFVPA